MRLAQIDLPLSEGQHSDMAKALQIVGLLWIAICVLLWVWAGFLSFEPNAAAGWMSWSLPRLLAESRFGLTMVPILLAIPGALLWQAGRG